MGENMMDAVLKSVSLMCGYIVQMHEIQHKNMELLKNAEIENRRLDIIESHLESQRETIKRSLDATIQELNSLSVSRQSLLDCLARISETIVSKESGPEEREIGLLVIDQVAKQVEKIAQESSVKFELLANSVIRSLDGPNKIMEALDE